MKGAGPTMVTVVLILILLFFFSIYSATLTNEANVQVAMNLQHAAELKLGNSFFLFNKSLATTWYISGVQTLFRSTDTYLGCGEDYKFDNFIDDGYWYQYDITKGGKIIDLANLYLGERDQGKNNKYNYKILDSDIGKVSDTNKNNVAGFYPHLCYPSNDNITEYLNYTFTRDFVVSLPATVTVNAVDYAVDQKGLLPVVNLADNGIQFSVEQPVTVTTLGNTVKQVTLNNMTVVTELPRIFNAARRFVYYLVNLNDNSDIFGNIVKYQVGDSKDDYVKKMETLFGSISQQIHDDAGLQNTKISTVFMTKDLYAAGTSDALLLDAGKGLIFHYKILENLSENSPDGKYYKDVPTGFAKTPLSLPVKAEDYLIALDCRNNAPASGKDFSVYAWSQPGDMVCCANYLFSCNTNIPGLTANQQIQLGNSIQQNNNDANDPGTLCVDALTIPIVQGATHITRTLACKDNGFQISDS